MPGSIVVEIAGMKAISSTTISTAIPTDLPRLKGFRYPREIIACAVGVNQRFAMGRADVEDLLAEKGVIVSRKVIRGFVANFSIAGKTAVVCPGWA